MTDNKKRKTALGEHTPEPDKQSYRGGYQPSSKNPTPPPRPTPPKGDSAVKKQ